MHHEIVTSVDILNCDKYQAKCMISKNSFNNYTIVNY